MAVIALDALASVTEYAGEPPSILVLGTFIAYAGIGALIAGKRPEYPIGWLLSAMGVLQPVQGLATAVRVYAASFRPPDDRSAERVPPGDEPSGQNEAHPAPSRIVD